MAQTLHVFIHTSPFKANFHTVSRVAQLPYPTDDTREIVALARQVAAALYTPGHAFLKAGVGLIDLADKRHLQLDLLHPGQSERADKLMSVLDGINRQQGKGAVFLASQGVSKPWYMRQQFTSPEYTTKWSDLPVAQL